MGRETDTPASASPQALASLLEQVAAGDRRALHDLYHATSPKLLSICLRILKDRSECEDVLQEVYITVWRRAGAFDAGRGGAMTWLGAIARNRAIDRLRARKPTQTASAAERPDVADESPSALDGLTDADERAYLHACIDELSPQSRDAIRTAFFEGLTYEQLAVRTGAPLGTVKSWVRRGLIRLKACLEP